MRSRLIVCCCDLALKDDQCFNAVIFALIAQDLCYNLDRLIREPNQIESAMMVP